MAMFEDMEMGKTMFENRNMLCARMHVSTSHPFGTNVTSYL